MNVIRNNVMRNTILVSLRHSTGDLSFWDWDLLTVQSSL